MKRWYIQLNGLGSRYVAHYIAESAEDAVVMYYASNPKAQKTATASLNSDMDAWIAERAAR